MQQIPVSELRVKLPAVLDGVERGERVAVTRDGEPVAMLLSPDEAAWCAALAARFRDRRPPLTQAALDAWTANVLARMDLSDLMEPAADARS